jgi:hypothetical protein
MPTNAKRKTRDQKIKSSERQVKQVQPIDYQTSDIPIATQQLNQNTTTTSHEYDYISHDLHKIGWIMLLCVALLAIATILISDLSPFVTLRQSLHLPTL